MEPVYDHFRRLFSWDKSHFQVATFSEVMCYETLNHICTCDLWMWVWNNNCTNFPGPQTQCYQQESSPIEDLAPAMLIFQGFDPPARCCSAVGHGSSWAQHWLLTRRQFIPWAKRDSNYLLLTTTVFWKARANTQTNTEQVMMKCVYIGAFRLLCDSVTIKKKMLAVPRNYLSKTWTRWSYWFSVNTLKMFHKH